MLTLSIITAMGMITRMNMLTIIMKRIIRSRHYTIILTPRITMTMVQAPIWKLSV
jgi:hypothetical protein